MVFGRVLHGLNVLRALEAVPRKAGDSPAVPVLVSECGEIPPAQYDAMLPGMEPEPRPRDLSMTTVPQPSISVPHGDQQGAASAAGSSSSSSGAMGAKAGPKGASAIGGPVASGGGGRSGAAVADIGSLSELLGPSGGLSADELLKRARLEALDVDMDAGPGQGGARR